MSEREELRVIEQEIWDIEKKLSDAKSRALRLRISIAKNECPIKPGDVIRDRGRRFMYRVEGVYLDRYGEDFSIKCYRINSKGEDTKVGKNKMVYSDSISYNPKAIPERQSVRVIGRIENGKLILGGEQ